MEEINIEPTVEVEVPNCDDCDCEDQECETVEAQPEPIESPKPSKAKPAAVKKDYVVSDGDTYAMLGKKFVKSGETPFEAANRIMTANGGKALVAGEVVKF
jgi:hypothetical protein